MPCNRARESVVGAAGFEPDLVLPSEAFVEPQFADGSCKDKARLVRRFLRSALHCAVKRQNRRAIRAEPIDASPEADAVEPRREACLTTKRAQRQEGLQEGVLHRLLGLELISEEGSRQAPDGVRIPAHEHLERLVVTFGGANSELRILHLMA
jgi:hypothetical protein